MTGNKNDILSLPMQSESFLVFKIWLINSCYQQWRSNASSNGRVNGSFCSINSQEFDKNSWGWSWLERWMAARPWETRLMEQMSHADTLETTPPPTKTCSDSLAATHTKSLEPSSVKVRRNTISTRVSAKPPHPIGQATRSSSSPSSEFRYDESSASSSMCTSTTPASGTEESACNNGRVPNYMNLTESTKAKQRMNNHLSQRIQRQSMDEFQFMKKSGVFSNGDSKSSAGSDPSINFSKPFYQPTRLDQSSMKQREREKCFYD